MGIPDQGTLVVIGVVVVLAFALIARHMRRTAKAVLPPLKLLCQRCSSVVETPTLLGEIRACAACGAWCVVTRKVATFVGGFAKQHSVSEGAVRRAIVFHEGFEFMDASPTTDETVPPVALWLWTDRMVPVETSERK